MEWLNEFTFKWIKDVFLPSEDIPGFKSLLCSLQTRLEFFAHECFASMRISEMFDIIIDFPDSMPALEDLRECLSKTHQLPSLIQSLSQA